MNTLPHEYDRDGPYRPLAKMTPLRNIAIRAAGNADLLGSPVLKTSRRTPLCFYRVLAHPAGGLPVMTPEAAAAAVERQPVSGVPGAAGQCGDSYPTAGPIPSGTAAGSGMRRVARPPLRLRDASLLRSGWHRAGMAHICYRLRIRRNARLPVADYGRCHRFR
jgi:hypothetical protein